jgi:hypothetical protein
MRMSASSIAPETERITKDRPAEAGATVEAATVAAVRKVEEPRAADDGHEDKGAPKQPASATAATPMLSAIGSRSGECQADGETDGATDADAPR